MVNNDVTVKSARLNLYGIDNKLGLKSITFKPVIWIMASLWSPPKRFVMFMNIFECTLHCEWNEQNVNMALKVRYNVFFTML